MAFSIGDEVRVKSGREKTPNSFKGTGTYQGQSQNVPYCVAIEVSSKSGMGGAQHQWWNFRKEDLDSLELVTETVSTIKEEPMDFKEFKKKFPVGSRFIVPREGRTAQTPCFSQDVEQEVVSYSVDPDGTNRVHVKRTGDGYLNNCQCGFWADAKLTKKEKGFMKKLNTMMRKLLDVDTQTLVKAGYLNGDLELTEEGKEALFGILFVANKAELVASAQAVLDEEAKENK